METQEEITIKEVLSEYVRANEKYPLFNSKHEAFGVLKEEIDELWDAIKDNDCDNMHKEAIHVAAMAVKLIVSCCKKNEQ
jgi:hypothetical protein